MIRTLTTIIAISIPGLVAAQISFTESHSALGVTHQSTGALQTGGVSTADFNQDGLDDITLASGDGDPLLFLQNTGSGFTPVSLNIINVEKTKQISWVDFDNDGDLDFFCANLDGANELWENNGSMSFTNITTSAGLDMSGSRTFTFDWGDYNRDGWLDLYVTNNVYGTIYDTVYSNYLYKNNRDGSFTNVTQYAGVPDSNKNPLAVTFADINNDLWPDLFIASDKMQGNVMFKNGGTGRFADISMPSGANQHICSMSSGTGDPNNDGYLDFYVTNSPPGNVFLVNNGNETFTESAASNGVGFYDESWGALFIDADNDGDHDLYVSGGAIPPTTNSAAMYENNGNAMFTQLTSSAIGMAADVVVSHANAFGDFNNDGFPDMVVNNMAPANSHVWMNDASSGNNWLKVKLQGTVSNEDAYGTAIDFYHNGTYQKRYHYCQGSFLSQKTPALMLGLGSDTLVDSLVIHWPSGLMETYTNVSGNQEVTYVEGALGTFVAQVFSEGTLDVCDGHQVTLYPNGRFTNVMWNGSIASHTYTPTVNGTYYFTALDPLGGNIVSDTVTVNHLAPMNCSVTVTDIDCYGDMDAIAISATAPTQNIVSTMWSTGDTSVAISGLGAGWYHMIETDIYGCMDTVSFMVTQPDSLELMSALTHNTCYGDMIGQIDATVQGGTPGYNYLWSTGATVATISGLPAGNYMLQISDSNGCMVSDIFMINEPTEIMGSATTTDEMTGNDGTIDLTVSGGMTPYTFSWDNGATTEDISGLAQGLYTVTITDSVGCQMVESYYVGSQLSISTNSESPVKVYPNPTSSLLNLELPETMLSGSMTLTDVTGKTLISKPITNTTMQLDLSGYSSGVYVVTILSEGESSTLRVVRK